MPPGNTPRVYFTFDDGPNPHNTKVLLQHLAHHQIKASFFLTGDKAFKYPELVEEIKSQGHAVCSHGWYHRTYRMTPLSHANEQLFRSLKLLETNYYRPPYGKIDPFSLYRLRKAGVKTILWNVDPKDYDPQETQETMIIRLSKRIRPGDIILLHDNPQNIDYTLKSIDHIISEIIPKGFSFSIFS